MSSDGQLTCIRRYNTGMPEAQDHYRGKIFVPDSMVTNPIGAPGSEDYETLARFTVGHVRFFCAGPVECRLVVTAASNVREDVSGCLVRAACEKSSPDCPTHIAYAIGFVAHALTKVTITPITGG